jgi:serine/threonine-protein kinase
MITGRKPFVEDEEKSVMHKIRLEKHVPARKLNPEIPRELDRIINKCLEKQPRNRWGSAQALVMALERFLAKHVEMNYHALLVLFLRQQDIITQLEADEYLNPALGGPSASALLQSSVANRRLIRRSLIFQGAVLGVAMLMVALIHLAPIGTARGEGGGAAAAERGYLKVVAHPWGRILIDGEERGTTPMAAPIEVPAGDHEIRIENDYLPAWSKTMRVPANEKDEPLRLDVDLAEPRK